MLSIKNGLASFFRLIKQTVLPTKRVETNYYLVRKTEVFPAQTLTNSSCHVPDNAVGCNMITVGRKNNPNFQRNIITFYDKDKKILKKVFSGTDWKQKIRTYNTICKYQKTCNNILKERNIQTKEYDNKKQEWVIKSEETQYIHHYLDEIRGFSHRKKLHINKNSYEYTDDKQTINASIIEYPSTPKEVKKEIKAILSINKDIPQIISITNTSDFSIPQNDKYLPYRFLIGKQKQTSLTRYQLNKNGLEPLNIGIYYSKEAVSPNTEGFFDADKGNIFFREVSKSHPIYISAHEAEHAGQYALIGQLGKLKTDYGYKCQKTLPSITNSATIKEGFDYVIANEQYPKIKPDENLSKNKLYWENGLEVGARKKAKSEATIYKAERRNFTDYFKYSTGPTDF